MRRKWEVRRKRGTCKKGKVSFSNVQAFSKNFFLMFQKNTYPLKGD